MTNLFSFILKSNTRVFCVIGLLVVLAYSFMLHSPFKNLDDEFSVVTNAEIRDLANIPHFFTSTYFKVEKDYYRPMVYVTYALEYHFFRLNYFFYNLDNVFIHLINAFLVFLVAGLLMNNRARAFAVGMIFAIHPIHWEAVGNVSGRAILLCALFVLSAFYFFLKYMRDERPVDLALTALCYALALLCKESAGVFVLAAGFYWLLFGKKSLPQVCRFWPLPAVAAGYMGLRHLMHITVPFPWPSWGMMALGVTTFLRGVLTYLRLIVLPLDLYFDRARPVFMTFKNPELLMTLAVYAVMLGVFFRYVRRLPLLAIFCVLWFWVELFPVSQIITSIGTYPGAIALGEHFMYLACIPVFILLVTGAIKLAERCDFSSRISALAAGGFMVFLYLTLIQQNIYAGNEFLVLKDSLKNDPKNCRVEYALAKVYVKAGDVDQALVHFQKAADLYPCNPNYQIALGKAWMDKGDYLKAVRVFEAMPSRKDINAIVDGNKKASYEHLAAEYEAKRRTSPRDPEVLFALGVFYGRLSRNAEAYESFAAVWSVDSTRFDALFNMGV
ncbi:MAG: tetratricopeptide repeat protein, partial [Candidatus Omnitrophica bacterium]|nr:tetratricopeptide repeat protein [Candidatus Omnitrophota bacterium]